MRNTIRVYVLIDLCMYLFVASDVIKIHMVHGPLCNKEQTPMW